MCVGCDARLLEKSYSKNTESNVSYKANVEYDPLNSSNTEY